jgi:UDP-N-acetyl-D-glucosamine dehydrogenase
MRQRKGLNGAKILILGVAYKKNVDDIRESPAMRLLELLDERGARTAFFDPYVPVIPETREHKSLAGRTSEPWSDTLSANYDAVLIVTDHDAVDYAAVLRNSALVVDTRNACRRAGINSPKLVFA